MQKKWQLEWFDRFYCHVLDKNFGDQEVQFFMRNLISFLKLKELYTSRSYGFEEDNSRDSDRLILVFN